MATALVTGGTSGIGLEFARQLAAQGHDVVLVARDAERLAAAAAEIHSAWGISVEALSADLALREDVERVAGRIGSSEHPVDIVVNNAGVAVKHSLASADQSAHDHAFELMNRAVLVLSSAAARAMTGRGHGAIINVSSLQTYLATGYYAATKAWVTAFTESLAVELHGTGVTATVVLPGWVSTEWHARAGASTSSIPGILWIEPDRVARSALRDVERGRVISIPTARYRMLGWLIRHLPRSTIRWVSRKLTARRRVPDPGSDAGRVVADRREG